MRAPMHRYRDTYFFLRILFGAVGFFQVPSMSLSSAFSSSLCVWFWWFTAEVPLQQCESQRLGSFEDGVTGEIVAVRPEFGDVYTPSWEGDGQMSIEANVISWEWSMKFSFFVSWFVPFRFVNISRSSPSLSSSLWSPLLMRLLACRSWMDMY